MDLTVQLRDQFATDIKHMKQFSHNKNPSCWQYMETCHVSSIPKYGVYSVIMSDSSELVHTLKSA